MKRGQIIRKAKSEFNMIDARNSVIVNGVLHKAHRYDTKGYWCTSQEQIQNQIATGDYPVANSMSLDTVYVAY